MGKKQTTTTTSERAQQAFPNDMVLRQLRLLLVPLCTKQYLPLLFLVLLSLLLLACVSYREHAR